MQKSHPTAHWVIDRLMVVLAMDTVVAVKQPQPILATVQDPLETLMQEPVWKSMFPEQRFQHTIGIKEKKITGLGALEWIRIA